MKYIYTLIFFLVSCFTFSQTITFECNNEIIVVSLDEISNDPNVYMDWNEDNLINELDYLIYLDELYDCQNLISDTDSLDFGGDNNWDFDTDSLDFGGDNDWDFDTDSVVLDFSDINWIDTGDFDENTDWNDFEWETVWSDYNLGSIVDWYNIPWNEIIDLGILPDDLIDYIISIIAEGQPFNWNNFITLQGCIDNDDIIATGLSIWTDVNGCSEAFLYINSLGYNCYSELNLPFVSADPITLFELCCETCEENSVNNILGCVDPLACNFDITANIDDGSCDYGVQCLVSPCSVSIDPGIDGAYCIDDYCEGCCALWYYPEGTLISNSCEEDTGDDSIVGFWYDADSDQYIEITEDVIGFYSFIDDEFFMCWYYWPMEYNDVGNGIIEILDPDLGLIEVSWSILDNNDLQLIDPEGENILMSPLNEIPEIDMCDNPTNEGCEDFIGQWVYLYPGTDMEVIWMEIDESGGDFFILGDDLCVDYINLSYDSIEGSDECSLFVYNDGFAFEFGQLSLNSDGNLSFSDMPGFPEDWPEIWIPGDFESENFTFCSYGCIDPNACNFDPFANADDGTCGLIDDCGDCQIPYCYTTVNNLIEYVTEDACDLTTSIWIGNDCENNSYCLSSPENLYWNAGCITINENIATNNLLYSRNILGQPIDKNYDGFKLDFYSNGSVEKNYLIK